MNPIYQTLIRSVLKTLGGYFIAKGFMDESSAEVITAGAATLIGVLWGLCHRGGPPADGAVKLRSSTPVLALAAALMMLPGCARFSSVQEQTKLDGTTFRQKQTVTTFFDGKSDIAKLRASSTDKTTGLSVGSISEESSGTNAVDLVDRVVGAAVGAAIKSAKP
jgi:hypothetical protein